MPTLKKVKFNTRKNARTFLASLSDEKRQEISELERRAGEELHNDLILNWFDWTPEQRQEETYQKFLTFDKFQDGHYESRPPQAEIMAARIFPENRDFYIKEYKIRIEMWKEGDPHNKIAKAMQRLLNELLKDG